MPNHKIANATSSMLDMSPLKDLLGHTLTLRAKEERVVDDKTFHDDIVQRVMKAGWATEVNPSAATREPAPEAPPVEEAPPEALPEPSSMPVEPSSMPVETVVTSEQPASEPPSFAKPGKKK